MDFKLQLALDDGDRDGHGGDAADRRLSRRARPTNISNDVKENLPTISAQPHRHRAHQSAVQRVRRIGRGATGAPVLSVAGNSFRYNSLQIDGADNNDLFGLASSAGAPGGAAETQPVSLDAIREIQLVVSPYDVRQGGFSGGGINAITKSGTNEFHGTGVLLRRATRTGSARASRARKIATFKDKQGGFRHRRPDGARTRRSSSQRSSGRARCGRPGVSVNGTGAHVPPARSLRPLHRTT